MAVKIEVHKLSCPNVPGVFDSDIAKVMLDYPWYWDDRYYWWFYADSASDCEWRMQGNTLEYNVQGHWTIAEFIGGEGPDWINLRRVRDYKDIELAILNGHTVGKTWCMADIPRDSIDWPPLRAERDRIRGAVSVHSGKGCANMPEFTPEQLEELRVKIGARYLAAAKNHAERMPGDWRSVMAMHAARLKEINFDPPEHDFTREPLIVPVYNYDGATFLSDPDVKHGGEDCECAKCAHEKEYYEDRFGCGCDNCMENDEHWYQFGCDPTHCNFCEDYQARLDAWEAAQKKEE